MPTTTHRTTCRSSHTKHRNWHSRPGVANLCDIMKRFLNDGSPESRATSVGHPTIVARHYSVELLSFPVKPFARSRLERFPGMFVIESRMTLKLTCAFSTVNNARFSIPLQGITTCSVISFSNRVSLDLAARFSMSLHLHLRPPYSGSSR